MVKNKGIIRSGDECRKINVLISPTSSINSRYPKLACSNRRLSIKKPTFHLESWFYCPATLSLNIQQHTALLQQKVSRPNLSPCNSREQVLPFRYMKDTNTPFLCLLFQLHIYPGPATVPHKIFQ